MPVETNKYSEVVYQIIESPCELPGDNDRTVYGLSVEFTGDAAEVITVGDICLDKADILRLVALMTEYGVTKEHLMDIIEDFVQSLYM